MRHRILLSTGLLLGLSLASCTATQHTPRQPVEYAEAIDTLASVTPKQSFRLTSALPASINLATLGLPPYLVPPPAGSTPRQRRQWQRAQAQNLARAGVQPQKIKNSSVATAPGATAVNRPSAPVATAPHAAATDNRKAGQRHGASAVGPGARAEATDKRGGTPWWVYLLVAVVGAAGWELFSVKVAPVRQLLKWRLA